MEINYDRCNVSTCLRTEIIHSQGELFWKQLSSDLILPADVMEDKFCSLCMHALMQKFQSVLPRQEIKSTMVNDRHDLQPDDFDWAIKLFSLPLPVCTGINPQEGGTGIGFSVNAT